MVKGISKQVILLQSPDRELFEQAIFILRDDAVGRKGVTDAQLLQEAKRLIGNTDKRMNRWVIPLLSAAAGALLTGVIWFAWTLI